MDGTRGEEEIAVGIGGEEGIRLARDAARECIGFLRPLLGRLDRKMDLRLVRTVANTVMAIVANRNRSMALLLSELGEYVAGGPLHSPAGTKRIDRLIHSDRWRAQEAEEHLLGEAGRVVDEEASRRGRALLILDGSVLEKSESMALEGLAPVRSSKARRLERPRPRMGRGYFRGAPKGPIVVPGFEWVSAVVAGWGDGQHRGAVALAGWQFYSRPRDELDGSSDVDRCKPQQAAAALLGQVVGGLGKERLLCVWDRGYSGSRWISQALDEGLAFVVRWKKGNKLRPADAPSVGQQASSYREEGEGVVAWRLTAGLRPWGHGTLANPRRPGEPITVSYAAREVRLLHRNDPLWLVVVRLGKGTKPRSGGSEPWRLITTEPVTTAQECWRVVLAYAARWNVEQTLRYAKSELGIESVRVRAWEPRRKLLALASLAYAFILQLQANSPSGFLNTILNWAHRTGRQATNTWRGLYRLRTALSNIWNKHTPSFQGAP